MRKLSFISITLAISQIIGGVVSIIYIIKVLGRVDNFMELNFDERRYYSGQFLKFFGGGALHSFTGYCLLARESAAPAVAIMVGMGSFAMHFFDAIKIKSYTSLDAYFCYAALFYIFWFLFRQSEFE